jgi:hypothetical protein
LEGRKIMAVSPIRRRLASSWIALCLFAAVGASADSLGNLYETTVPVGTAGEAAAFRAGMSDVLVRVTGRRDAPALAGLAPLVSDASRYVISYRRATGGNLTVAFDGDAVEQAVAAAGLPFWGEQRPLTLVWMAVDRGGGQRGLVTAEAASSERRVVEQAAMQRGLPLVWPSAGSDENLRGRFEQVWSGDIASLAAAAGRYGAEGVLIGRAVSTGRGQYTVDWSSQGAGGSLTLRGDLEDGVHATADRYASRYASTSAGQRNELLVTISGVTTLARYADVTRYLESLGVVRELSVHEVQPEAVVFRLTVRGDLGALQREVAAGGHLVRADGGSGAAIFSYRP